jgi:hypothetical protein
VNEHAESRGAPPRHTRVGLSRRGILAGHGRGTRCDCAKSHQTQQRYNSASFHSGNCNGDTQPGQPKGTAKRDSQKGQPKGTPKVGCPFWVSRLAVR